MALIPPLVYSKDYNIQELNTVVARIYEELNNVLEKTDENPPIKVLDMGNEYYLVHKSDEGTFGVSAQKATGDRFTIPSVNADGVYKGLKANVITLKDSPKSPGDIGFTNGTVKTKTSSTTSFSITGSDLEMTATANDSSPSIKLGSGTGNYVQFKALYAAGTGNLQKGYISLLSGSSTPPLSITINNKTATEITATGVEMNNNGGTKAVSGQTYLLTLSNWSAAASMADTKTSILFNQHYHTGGVANTERDAGKITVGTEGNWTGTAGTQHAFMSFSTVYDGTQVEHVKIFSNSQVFIKDKVGLIGTPSGGGYLYVDSGALKYIGSSGTITTLGAA